MHTRMYARVYYISVRALNLVREMQIRIYLQEVLESVSRLFTWLVRIVVFNGLPIRLLLLL